MAERITRLLLLWMWEKRWRDFLLFPTSSSRYHLVALIRPTVCFVSARDLFLGAKQVRRAMVHTSGQQKWISALALGAPGSNASPSRGLSYPG